MGRDELLECTGVDVTYNPELWAALVNNPKLRFNEEKATLQYRVRFR